MWVIYQLFHCVPVNHHSMEWGFSICFWEKVILKQHKVHQKLLFCLQVCELAFRDVLSTVLSIALVSVPRGFLSWCAMASQIHMAPDGSILLLFCTHFKISFCISLCNIFSNYLFPVFSFDKKLSNLTLRELENGSRGGNLSSLSWLQCSSLQLLSIIS